MMTKDALDQMAALITQYAEEELDQHIAWEFETSHGRVRVTITRVAEDGT